MTLSKSLSTLGYTFPPMQNMYFDDWLCVSITYKGENKNPCQKKLKTKGLHMGKELYLILLEPSISGISRRYIIAKWNMENKSRNRVSYLSFLLQVDRLKITLVICLQSSVM